MAYYFLGLNKANPNGNKWQPQTIQYIKKLFKVPKHTYIWNCGNSFSMLPITYFLLNSEIRKKNYYSFRSDFKKSINKLVIKRLKSDLNVRFYNKQSSLCLVCKKQKQKKSC